MLFAEYARCQYARSPLVEVICQLRFPSILSIGAKEPAEFQEAVRREFPRYAARQEQPAPRVTAVENGCPLRLCRGPTRRYSSSRLSPITILSRQTGCGS